MTPSFRQKSAQSRACSRTSTRTLLQLSWRQRMATRKQVRGAYIELLSARHHQLTLCRSFCAAVNVLLSMTPGNDSAPAPPPRSQHMSADEALARSLALEEDEAYAREAQAREDQRRYAGRRNQQQPPIPPRQGGRGGGGAASFFNELKQSVQPLFDGKGPLARDGQRQQYESAGGLASSSGPSYDPSQLTYQPRVRKAPAARAGGAPVVQQQQQPLSQNASWSRDQPPTSATSTPQNTQQQQQWRGGAAPAQSQAPHQPIRLFGTPQTPTAPPRDTGKGREVLTGAGAGAAAGGAAVGAATGAAAAGAASSSAAAPPASIASILEQGRRDATSPNSNGEDDDDADADDVDSDDLEYQKSPFDDED